MLDKSTIKICVASQNPVKLECTKLAFESIFDKTTMIIDGKSAHSGVSDQPMTDQETLLGAMNRAVFIRKNFPAFDFHIGIEGGVEDEEEGMSAFAWVYIIGKRKNGKARTAAFYLPEEIRQLVKGGMELGHADDMVFKRENSKQKDGAIGILTNGTIDRTEYYKPAVLMALIPFLHNDLTFVHLDHLSET